MNAITPNQLAPLRSTLIHNKDMQAAFRMETVKALSATETFTKSLQKQDVTFGKLIKSRQMMNKLILEQQRLQRMTMLGTSVDAKGRISGETFIPRDVPARVTSFRKTIAAAQAGQITFAEAIRDGRVKLGLYSQAMASAAQNGINLGKNLQWTGRQLSMGLTLPLVMFGAMAGKIANEVDKELTRITKVYTFTADEMATGATMAAAKEEVRARAMDTARQSAALYGTKLEDTLAIEAELAAAGKRGLELQQMTNIVNRAATLGELDRQDALKATITLQNVYGLGAKGLADSFNYINQLENNTSVQAQDMVVAIPKVSAVVKSLGGTLQDTGTLMTAATVGGIKASEAANTLKTMLFRVATGQGGKTFLDTTGESLENLRKQSNGELLPWLTSIGKEIDQISDPTKRTAVLKDLLGVYQGSKGGTIFDQLARNTEQVQKALEAAGITVNGINDQTNVWAATANRELADIQVSASGKLKRAVQSFRAQMVDMGEPFLEVASKVMGVLTAIVKFINGMPSIVKKGLAGLIITGAIIGPIVMLAGLFINLANTIMKAGASITGLAARFKAVTQEERAAELAAKQASGAFLSEAESIQILNTQLREMTQQLIGLPGHLAAATGTILPRTPVARVSTTTATSTGPMAGGAVQARASVAYQQQAAVLQDQFNRGLMDEARLRNELNLLEARNNPFYLAKVELQEKLNLGKITQIEYDTTLTQLEFKYDEMAAVRANLQKQLISGLITELEMKEQLVMAENRILVARERQAIEQNNQRQRVSAVSGSGAGGGILMGTAMIGMMAGSMGILNEGTSKWVSTVATGLFMMSAIIPITKAIKVGMVSVAATQKVIAAGTAVIQGGLKGLIVTTRLWGLAIMTSLGPIGLIAAAIAAIGTGMLLLFRHADNIKKKMDSWGDTSRRTADQVGITLGGGFENAAGKIDKVAEKTKQARTEAEKWAKANEESYKIISNKDDQEAAAAEVNRIGIDIYEATGNAKKAREAMLLAINGSQNEGLIAKLKIETAFENDDRTMEALKGSAQSYIDTIAKSTFNAGEKLKVWNFGPSSWTKNYKDLLSDTGISASKTLAGSIKETYDAGNLEMFQKKVKTTNDALTQAVADGTLSANKAKEARREMVRELIKQKAITPDAVENEYDLVGAEKAMAAALKEATDAELMRQAAVVSGQADIEVSAELLEKLNKIQQDVMKSVWSDVLNKANDDYNEGMQAQMDAVVKRGQAALDKIDADAKDKDKDFEKQGKALDARYEHEENLLKSRQDKRKAAEDKVYDDQIKRIEDQIDAEKKIEDNRQKMFEAERTRIQRLSEMYNKNLDLNIALNAGNMDEAARIQNDMASTEDTWAVSDTAAASGDASQGIQDSLEARKDAVSNRKEIHDKYLDSLDKKEENALQNRKDRDKEALESAKERYHEEVDAHKKAQEQMNSDAQKAEAKRQKIAKESLDAELAYLQSYIPKNEADIRDHINKLQAVYDKHGKVINTKSAEWATSVSMYITKATNSAKGELAGDEEWAVLGGDIGDKLMKGMLGMSVDEFNAWIQNGARADATKLVIPPKPKNFNGSQANWNALFNHGGGLVGSNNNNRGGRSMSHGLFRDEVPTVLQRGEFVVDKDTTSKMPPGFLHSLKNGTPGRVPETGGPGLMAGLGTRAISTFAAAMSTAIPFAAKSRAQDDMAHGRAVPEQIQKFLGAEVSAAVAGKYGDVELSAEQLQNAASIISTGRSMGATDRDILIGLMTALQESSLKNIGYGDQAGPDSRGLFQQRDSWGDLATRMSPSGAARLFFEREMQVRGRDKLPLTQVAQKVQVSAYPNAYAKWENEARAILSATGVSNSGGVGYKGGKGGRGVDSVNDIIGLIQGRGVPFRVTSTYRPGATTHSSGNLSYHATKNAVDFGGVPAGSDSNSLLGINRFFAGLGKGLIELIYSGPGGINLRNGQPHTYDATTRADHHDHVHVAATKDALSKLPSMRIGGEVMYDNTIANLHKKETVLTAPLSEELKRGISNLDQNAGSEYNITMDMRGSTIDSNFDIDGALEKAIQKREAKSGRVRRIS